VTGIRVRTGCIRVLKYIPRWSALGDHPKPANSYRLKTVSLKYAGVFSWRGASSELCDKHGLDLSSSSMALAIGLPLGSGITAMPGFSAPKSVMTSLAGFAAFRQHVREKHCAQSGSQPQFKS